MNPATCWEEKSVAKGERPIFVPCCIPATSLAWPARLLREGAGGALVEVSGHIAVLDEHRGEWVDWRHSDGCLDDDANRLLQAHGAVDLAWGDQPCARHRRPVPWPGQVLVRFGRPSAAAPGEEPSRSPRPTHTPASTGAVRRSRPAGFRGQALPGLLEQRSLPARGAYSLSLRLRVCVQQRAGAGCAAEARAVRPMVCRRAATIWRQPISGIAAETPLDWCHGDMPVQR